MKTAEYYSSLPNEKKQPTSPVFASSPISLAVTSASMSAKKLLTSLVPTKLLSAQCSNSTPLKRGDIEEDEIPVIYFPDEDSRTVKRKVPAFIDPYSFVPTTDENCGGVGKKSGNFNSPTSVIPVRLFPEAADGSVEVVSTAPLKDSGKLDDDSIFDPVVTFQCPIFSLDTTNSKDDDDTTSLQLSEAIRSINIKDDDTKSVREKLRDMKDARSRQSESNVWEESWVGFTRSSSWRKYEWKDDAK